MDNVCVMHRERYGEKPDPRYDPNLARLMLREQPTRTEHRAGKKPLLNGLAPGAIVDREKGSYQDQGGATGHCHYNSNRRRPLQVTL